MTDHLTAEDAARLRSAILDIDAHATPMGEDSDGFVAGGYLISTGSLHRALGVVGHPSAKCRRCATGTTCEEYRAQGAEDYQRESLEALCAAAGIPIGDESGPRANFYLVDALAAALADSVPKVEHEALRLRKNACRDAAHERSAERDAALAEVTRLREALEEAVRLIPKSAERSEVDRLTRAIRVVVSSPVCHPHNAIVLRAALAEGSDVPGVVPACAGRSVVAHERTQMTPAPSGWRCPVCGETVALAEGSDVLPTQRDH